MGGGSGGGSMQSTTVTSNIPEYAKPYVENMLGAAEQQIFTTGPDGSYNGYRPYQPYSVNPQNYFAAPTQLQQQAYSESLGMQTPGQFATGTGMASLAGTGQLGLTNTARQYGAMGAGYGNEAADYGATAAGMANTGFNAGNNYNAIATTPSLFQPYMSPYINQVIQPQLAKAQSDYETASTQANLASARQGAYGGARQALQQSEREKGLAINKSNIIGQGLQDAYNNAMQSIQFGSGLGLQGLSTAYQGLGLGQQGAGLGMQGASIGLQGVGTAQQGLAGASATGANLANIGSAQQQADLNRLQQQNAMGSQYQDYQQGIINQAVQDYATAQQYPYMQLGMMSSLVRGLPMQNMTTQQYQAQPSMLQQGAGLLGAYGAYKGAFKEGGAVKRYDVGGSIEQRVKKIAEADPTGKGLASLMAKTKSPEIKRMIQAEMQANAPVRMAEGGTPPRPRANLREQLAGLNEAYQSQGVPTPGGMGEYQQRLMDKLAEQEAGAGQRYDEDSRLRKALAFLEFGSNRLGPLQGAIAGGKSFLSGEAEARQNMRAADLQRAGMMAQIDQGRIAGAQQHIGQAQAQVNAVNRMMDRMDRSEREIASREGIARDNREAANARNAATVGVGQERNAILQARGLGSRGEPIPTQKDFNRLVDSAQKALTTAQKAKADYHNARNMLGGADPSLQGASSYVDRLFANADMLQQAVEEHPLNPNNRGAQPTGGLAAVKAYKPKEGRDEESPTPAVSLPDDDIPEDIGELLKAAQMNTTQISTIAKTWAKTNEKDKNGMAEQLGLSRADADKLIWHFAPRATLGVPVAKQSATAAAREKQIAEATDKLGYDPATLQGIARLWDSYSVEDRKEIQKKAGLSNEEMKQFIFHYLPKEGLIPQ